MAETTKIEWCDSTFNCWRGCSKISDGCAHCYAATTSKRNPAVLGRWGDHGTRVVMAEDGWREALKWERKAAAIGKRHRVFCASLADVFEDWRGVMSASDGAVLHVCGECGAWRTIENMCHGPTAHQPLTMSDVRARLFALIDATPNLDWQLLTKRPENIGKMLPGAQSKLTTALRHKPGTPEANIWHWPNIWLGVSVENQEQADKRIPELLKIPAAVRFLSMEPLLGPVELNRIELRKHGATPTPLSNDLGDWIAPLTGAFKDSPRIHWVIVGGESGHHARPMHPQWARSIRDQCQAAGVPYFFKQWGEWMPVEKRLSDGGAWQIKSWSWPGVFNDSCLLDPDGQRSEVTEDWWLNQRESKVLPMARVGKKMAGRLLDGREWSEFPKGGRPCSLTAAANPTSTNPTPKSAPSAKAAALSPTTRMTASR